MGCIYYHVCDRCGAVIEDSFLGRVHLFGDLIQPSSHAPEHFDVHYCLACAPSALEAIRALLRPVVLKPIDT